MAITVTYTTRSSKALDIHDLRRRIRAAQMRYAMAVAELYDETTATWDHTAKAYPEVRSKSTTASVVNIYIRGDRKEIYSLLDVGYERKFAMTKDFVPKTQPGVLRARPGKGGVARSKPKKGESTGAPRILPEPRHVVARRFTETIANILRSGQIFYGTYGDFILWQMNQTRSRHIKKVVVK